MNRKVRYRSRQTDGNKTTAVVKKTERRSKSGCLTCRNRKKKCDELRPSCQGCRRNFLECIWPEDCLSPAQTNEVAKKSDEAFFNLTVEDLKSTYSCSNPKSVTKYKNLSAIKSTENFVTLHINKKGGLKLSGKDGRYMEVAEFPTIEQLTNDSEDFNERTSRYVYDDMDEKTLNRERKQGAEDMMEGSLMQTEEEVRNITNNKHNFFESTQGQTEHKKFFDLKWIPNQIFDKSNVEFNWFTRQDNFEPLESSFNVLASMNPPLSDEDVSNEPGNSPEESFSSKERLKETFYNYLYDENDILAKKYRCVMQQFNKHDFSLLNEVSTDEHFLIYACVNWWLPKMGPQDTHPLLTTAATFTSHFESNYVVKEVFLCCGATYLEWYDHERFGELSRQLYSNSLALIKKYLNENPFYGTEAWLLASYQLLCLRNKTTSNTTVDDCVFCLSNSYRIIKATYYISESASSSTTKEERKINETKVIYPNDGTEIQTTDDQSSFERYAPTKTHQQVQNIAYEIENVALEIEEQIDDVKKHLILQPHERMFIESFIYNYSVAILWASDISGLPNPFSVFKEMSHVLKCPIYHCEFQWMNNPILGAAPDAFEILAKVSYIARLKMPLDPNSIWFKRAQQLHTMAHFYTSSVLPTRATGAVDKKTFESCTLNVHVGKILTKVCYLLLCKILQYDTYDVSQAQDVVAEVVYIMEKIPRDNLMWGILTWAIIICGVFAVKPVDQNRILEYLSNIGEMLHMLTVFKTKRFLQEVWDAPVSTRLNVLFDRKSLIRVNC